MMTGCSAVLVARLNGVQEAVSSILATRTKQKQSELVSDRRWVQIICFLMNAGHYRFFELVMSSIYYLVLPDQF